MTKLFKSVYSCLSCRHDSGPVFSQTYSVQTYTEINTWRDCRARWWVAESVWKSGGSSYSARWKCLERLASRDVTRYTAWSNSPRRRPTRSLVSCRNSLSRGFVVQLYPQSAAFSANGIIPPPTHLPLFALYLSLAADRFSGLWNRIDTRWSSGRKQFGTR